MTKVEQAISAVRGEMRHNGIDPEVCCNIDAEFVLDDLARKGIEAGLWWWSASDKDVTKFRTAWMNQ